MSWLHVAQQTSIGPIHAITLAEPTGPHLLFLHGVTRNHRDWSLVLSALAARFTPWAIDFRGHGNSARSPSSTALFTTLTMPSTSLDS